MDHGFNPRWGYGESLQSDYLRAGGCGGMFGGFAPVQEGFFPPPEGYMWVDPMAPPVGPGMAPDMLPGFGGGGYFGEGFGAGFGGDPYGGWLSGGPVNIYPGQPGQGMIQNWGGHMARSPDPELPRNCFERPGIHMKNQFGGTGVPPGYNYVFPEDSATIHVLLSDEPPWQTTMPMRQEHYMVPCNTNVKDLMKAFGCNNEEAEKNVITEVTQAGDGKWYKGLTIKGDNKDRMKMPISDLGWTKARNGVEQDVIWLYLTKG